MPLGRRNRRSMLAGAAIATSRSNKRQAMASQQQPAVQQSAPAPAPAPTTNNDDMYVQLEKLGALKDKGLLTQEEFDAKKKQILGL